MRIRTGMTALMVALLALFAAAPSAAAFQLVPIAQGDEQPEEQDVQGEDAEEGEGQSDPEAETDPGSEGEGDAAVEETGPLWTYQMAWITLGGLVLLFLATGLLYWRLVVVRTRRGM